MSTPETQAELVPAESAPTKMKRVAKPKALAPAAPQNEWLAVLERLASNPDVDLSKIEKLIDLKERTDRSAAEAAFYAAYAKMQGELPEVEERGTGDRGEKGGSYKYARFEDIMAAVRPIMGRHGFGIRFEHTVENGLLVCTGILSHEAGHSIRDRFAAAPDVGGNKPAIQANGSTRSYGQRYTLIALLGIATKGVDNDGATSQAPTSPDGFDDWWQTLHAVADEGMPKLSATFNQSKPEFKTHVLRAHAKAWAALKARALNAGGANA